TRSRAIGKLGLDKLAVANEQGFKPLYDYYKKYFFRDRAGLNTVLLLISFDFGIKEDQSFSFYLRTKDQFEIWEYDYSDFNDKRSNGWCQNILYRPTAISYFDSAGSIDTTYLLTEEGPSVFDSLFFDGHFKVFRQADNTFLFNLKNGSVYYLAEKGIPLIGRIQVVDYPTWILNKPLIIEDQDNGEIILLREVERLNNDYPFPRIRVYASREELPAYLLINE
ncbi:MAG: hypothetical protein KDD15_20390, partial [Lewinella sp.]|nr:hypothetical protein [Lewinella sp.]